MLFNSLDFLVFFPVVVCIYFATPHRFRWVLLLAASYYFYMSWKAEYGLLLLLTTFIDYYAAILIGRSTTKVKRFQYLALSLGSNLGLLFVFKYFNFFNDSVRATFNYFNVFYGVPAFQVLLPVGISFYTFQSMSYTIDVYRGQIRPEKHFGIFALYVSFFPQLVAGPIERSGHLLPQFYQRYHFDYDRVVSGLKLMAWGFFKKLVIADRVAVAVNNVYNNPTDHTGIPLLMASYLFAFQIYCDFSGYSDIAVGSARVMGFDLMQNFRQPYFSKSIGEFWTRWHISLSTWFRDYLYTPLLQSNWLFKRHWYYNLLVVFLVSGFWHGANWTFVIWGALHGFYLVFSIWTVRLRASASDLFQLSRFPRLHEAMKMVVTFHLVTFAWIFFRANSVSDAFYIVSHLFVGLEPRLGFGVDLGLFEFLIAGLAILCMELVQLKQTQTSVGQFIARQPFWIRWATYYALLFVILLFGKFDTREFIYFQF